MYKIPLLILIFVISISSRLEADSKIKDTVKQQQGKAKTSVLLPQVISAATVKNTIKGDSASSAKMLINRAIESIYKNNYVKAYSTINDAIDFCPKNNKALLTKAQIIQARLRISSSNKERAINGINRCDSMVKELNIDTLAAMHYTNIGLYYKQTTSNSGDPAMWFNRALEIYRKINIPLAIADNINNLASVTNSPNENILLLNEAISIIKKEGYENVLAISYINIAEQYISKGENPQALRYLDSAIVLSVKTADNESLYHSYKTKADVLAKAGKYKEAYLAIDTATEFKGKFVYVEKVDNIEQYIDSRRNAQKELQYQLDKRNLDVRILNRTMIIAIISILLLLLLIIGGYAYFNYKKKISSVESKKLIAEKESYHSRKELTNLATYLSARQTILSDISEKISKSLKLKDKDAQEREIKKINVYIKNLLDTNEDAAELNDKIDQINTNFIKRLEVAHPELTKNDKKIASLLRANLSTKQISAVMNTNPSSINIARHRMRQHLGLDTSENLVDYLKKV